MSVAEVEPSEQAEIIPDFPRNHLGELVCGECLQIGDVVFDPDTTIREVMEELDVVAEDTLREIDDLRADAFSINEELNKWLRLLSTGLVSETNENNGRLKDQSSLIGILELLTRKLNDVNQQVLNRAVGAIEAEENLDSTLLAQINQARLEESFETDIESPLSWSKETWQAIGSMTAEEQEFFAGKKKRSNASKRGWATQANNQLHESMLMQAIDDTKRLGGNLDNVRVETPNYTYHEWQIIKPLAEQADRANSMLYASMLEEAKEEAGAQGKNPDDVKVEKPNYTYEEWKAMEALHNAIKERQSDAAKRGWATRMNSKLPDGEEYTYQQWQDIKAYVQAENGGAEVD